jgi:hypothetical protein
MPKPKQSCVEFLIEGVIGWDMDRSKFGRCVFLGQRGIFWWWMVACHCHHRRRMVPL